jgi:hypothetical protein
MFGGQLSFYQERLYPADLVHRSEFLESDRDRVSGDAV